MPEKRVLEELKELCNKFGRKYEQIIKIMHDTVEAAKGADVIYTDSWMSYGVNHEDKDKVRFYYILFHSIRFSSVE